MHFPEGLMRAEKTAIRIQYFLYFGAMGVFLPYFNLYCLHIGFSGFQIGSLNAVRAIVLILFSILWGILADRRGLRRPIYILCSFSSIAIGVIINRSFNSFMYTLLHKCGKIWQ